MKLPIRSLNIFLILCVFQGCKTTNGQRSEVRGLVDNAAEPWPNRTINICWAPSKFKNVETIKEFMKIPVTQQFARAGLSIVGWENCIGETKEGGPYPVILSDEGNFTNLTGWAGRMDGIHIDIIHDMKLGMPFNCSVKDQDYINSTCILGTFLHEMGHFVGLHHEHERLDTGRRCNIDSFNSAPEIRTNFGPFDGKSVMNYCLDDKAAATGKILFSAALSDLDVETIKAIYNRTATALTSNTQGHRAFIDQNKLTVKLDPQYAKSYRFQVAFTEIDALDPCPAQSFSKESRLATEAIEVDLRNVKNQTLVNICVIGTNSAGIEQSAKVYSSLTYIVDRTPTAKLKVERDNVGPSLEPLIVDDTGIDAYVYKIVPPSSPENVDVTSEEAVFQALNPCLVNVGYSEPKKTSEPILFAGLVADTQYTVCLRGISKSGEIQSLNKASSYYVTYAQ